LYRRSDRGSGRPEENRDLSNRGAAERASLEGITNIGRRDRHGGRG